MIFEHEVTLFDGCDLLVEFSYWPATPDTRHCPGEPAGLEVSAVFHNGERADAADMLDVLIDALESYLMDHFDDWYDDPYAGEY